MITFKNKNDKTIKIKKKINYIWVIKKGKETNGQVYLAQGFDFFLCKGFPRHQDI